MPARFYEQEVKSKLKDKRALSAYLDSLANKYIKGLKKVHLTYIFCSDSYLLGINKEFLNHDTLTDIVTFDMTGEPNTLTGEIYISIERVAENAEKFGVDYINELHRVYEVMKDYGLERGQNGLQVYLMAEIPSNIILADEFAAHIDGFSIGSNDLTQLTLGLDRDSSLVADLYDERNKAVKILISNLIGVAKTKGVKVGICGQGPSDFPDFAAFLVEQGIDSISVTPDSVLKTIQTLARQKDTAGVIQQ